MVLASVSAGRQLGRQAIEDGAVEVVPILFLQVIDPLFDSILHGHERMVARIVGEHVDRNKTTHVIHSPVKLYVVEDVVARSVAVVPRCTDSRTQVQAMLVINCTGRVYGKHHYVIFLYEMI